MFFPQFEPSFYDEKDRGLKSRIEAFYASSITINQSFWSEADIDTRFEVGDQTLWSDVYGNLPANRKKQFNFNRIRRVINMISGHQRRTRKSTVVVPVENGDNKTADQFTKVMMSINRQECLLETISESFQGALVTGMNLLQVWVDYRNDPVSGNIKVDNCSYNSFLIDPYFRKADLSDCNGILKRSFLSIPDVISLLPNSREDILALTPNDAGTGRDGKFQFMPESYNMGYKDLLTYDEFYYRSYRKQKLLVDTQSGETLEWKSENNEGLQGFLDLYPQMTMIESEIPTVNLGIVVEGKVFYDGPNPLGIDNYPFVPVFSYYNPQMPYFPNRIQGVVRGLRDAQYIYNRRKIIELDILESQMNSGWIYKENSLVNPKDVFMNGQGRGLALKDEAQMTDVQQIMAPSIPESMIKISELMGREIMEISGVNDELLGSAMDDKAGVLSMLRQGAGLTTLQVLFDQLDRSQKNLGKIIIDVIQANYTPGKIRKIIQDEPTPQFYSKAFGKYDASVEDGLNTNTQRQMQFAQLLQLKEVGVPISTADLLEASTMQGKDKIIKNAVAQEQQAMQLQQQQAQMAMQEIQARMRSYGSKSNADDGLAAERYSRVDENKSLAVERLHESNREDSTAALNKIKATKELEGMDIEHLSNLAEIVSMIQGKESARAEDGVATVASSV